MVQPRSLKLPPSFFSQALSLFLHPPPFFFLLSSPFLTSPDALPTTHTFSNIPSLLDHCPQKLAVQKAGRKAGIHILATPHEGLQPIGASLLHLLRRTHRHLPDNTRAQKLGVRTQSLVWSLTCQPALALPLLSASCVKLLRHAEVVSEHDPGSPGPLSLRTRTLVTQYLRLCAHTAQIFTPRSAHLKCDFIYEHTEEVCTAADIHTRSCSQQPCSHLGRGLYGSTSTYQTCRVQSVLVAAASI